MSVKRVAQCVKKDKDRLSLKINWTVTMLLKKCSAAEILFFNYKQTKTNNVLSL